MVLILKFFFSSLIRSTKITIKCGSLDLSTTRHVQHLFLHNENENYMKCRVQLIYFIYGICCCWHNSCVRLSCVRNKLSPFIFLFFSVLWPSHTRNGLIPEHKTHEQLIHLIPETRMLAEVLSCAVITNTPCQKICCKWTTNHIVTSNTSWRLRRRYQFHCNSLSDETIQLHCFVH